MKLLGILAALTMIAATSSLAADDKPRTEEMAIRQRTQAFGEAWNRHDGKALAAFFTDDGDLIDPSGRLARGRDQVEKFFTEMMDGPFKDSSNTFTVSHVNLIKPDVAVVDWDANLTNAKGPDGKTMPVCKHHVTVTMVRQNDQWMFAAARPVEYPSMMDQQHESQPAAHKEAKPEADMQK